MNKNFPFIIHTYKISCFPMEIQKESDKDRRKKMTVSRKIMEVIRGLLASYVFTGVVLALLAFFVYRFEWSEKMVNMGITATYLIATLIGGIYVGKKIQEKKFIWGILLGILYMSIILGTSFLVNQEITSVSTGLYSTFILCIGGGMVGGMLS